MDNFKRVPIGVATSTKLSKDDEGPYVNPNILRRIKCQSNVIQNIG